MKKTDNLLMINPLPDYMGTSGEGSIGAPTVNIGAMENRGYAFSLNTINIDRGGFQWSTNFNISGFTPKITKFYSEAAIIDRVSWYMNNWTQRSVVGRAPWLFYGYVQEGIFQSVEEIQNSAIPLYNIVWFSYNDKASHGLGDARGGVLTSGSYQVDNVRMNTTGVTGENGSSWRSFYNVVGQSNTLISNINKYTGTTVPEDVKQQAIGEARFMRGLAYSYLVQNWGPVPIITNNTTLLQDTSIARNTVESVWEFIIRDMRFATENLPVASVQRGRLNQWAAEGMLAKMYLTRAGISGTRSQSDLDSAAYFAKRVIDNSGASLLPNYEDLFLTKNNNNAESLFALQWTYNGNWGSQNSVQAFLVYSSSITGFADGWGGDIGASKYILDKYEPTDKRRKATFMLPGDHYPYIHQQINDPDNPGKTLVQELNVPLNTVDGQRYNTRAGVKKYVVGRPEDNDGRVLQQRTEINTYMLRLADVYLVYAEAVLGNNAATSDASALQYFNAVRTRAGLQPKTSITWDDIYHERLLEFTMEGQAWYDLVRLHYYNPQKAFAILNSQDRGSYRIVPNSETNATSWTINSDTPAIYPVDEGNFYLPYPATELSRAPNLRKPPVPYDFSKQ